MSFATLVLPRVGALDRSTRERIERGSARLGAGATFGLGLGLGLVLLRQADELRFPGDPLVGAVEMLLGTSWMTFFWWGLGGALAILVGTLLAATGRRIGWGIAALALLPSVVFPGLIGHANAADARLLALGIDAVHVTAAGTWIGTLGVLVLAGRGWLDRLVPAFSPVAMVSVGVIVLSGAAASWRMIDPLSAYWTTDYGRTLGLKVALFGVVAILGFVNWRRLTPRLGSPEGDRAMRRSATAEFLLGHVVLLITAILVRTAPPG